MTGPTLQSNLHVAELTKDRVKAALKHLSLTQLADRGGAVQRLILYPVDGAAISDFLAEPRLSLSYWRAKDANWGEHGDCLCDDCTTAADAYCEQSRDCLCARCTDKGFKLFTDMAA